MVLGLIFFHSVFHIVIIHSHQKGCKWINLIIISIISLVDREKCFKILIEKKF